MPTTGRYSQKLYRCASCGFVQLHGTNHWGEFYDRCPRCSWKSSLRPVKTWECLESMPKGFVAPPKWRTVSLKEVAELLELKAAFRR